MGTSLTFIAFLFIASPLLIMPHSGGGSTVRVGTGVTKTAFRSYGLPTWIKYEETNGLSRWTVDSTKLGILFAIAASLALFFAWLSTVVSLRPDRPREPKR